MACTAVMLHEQGLSRVSLVPQVGGCLHTVQKEKLCPQLFCIMDVKIMNVKPLSLCGCCCFNNDGLQSWCGGNVSELQQTIIVVIDSSAN